MSEINVATVFFPKPKKFDEVSLIKLRLSL
jgi:hypothetical protein